jgi:hypothetical protein
MLRLMLMILCLAGPAVAETQIRQIDTQFIAALGSPGDTHGTNAAEWGLWEKDPGPRGVWLKLFPALATAGYAPAGWQFDAKEWWLEEHGLIMEKPQFPLAPGQYVVTGGRQVTTVLTIGAPDATGAQSWSLADGATLDQVTHLACRSAVYRPAAGAACNPGQARSFDFPVSPGATMPAVGNCTKQDYAVLFVIGRVDS